jgi:hypothetical protein
MSRTPLRRLFFFFDPKVYGGSNIPQVRYTGSAAPILWEFNVGAGYELPKNFELRVTHHDVSLLGRYAGPGGATNLRTVGPYGVYTTVGVRWYFGDVGHSTMRAR